MTNHSEKKTLRDPHLRDCLQWERVIIGQVQQAVGNQYLDAAECPADAAEVAPVADKGISDRTIQM